MVDGLTSFRTEADLLGPVQVPAGAWYGAQTQRAVQNFPLGTQRSIGEFPTLVRGLIWVKLAAAAANQQAGFLSAEVSQALATAGEQLLQSDDAGREFPIHALHGGGGTSANMNANEVLANMAEVILGGERGCYQHVHPNGHVNLHQSTNDVYPTACRIAVIFQWPFARRALSQLASEFARASDRFGQQPRMARTCLQDAVEISFADLFSGYIGLIERSTARTNRAVDDLHAINLGGTIVGRSQDAPQAYQQAVIPALCELLRDQHYRRAENLFDAAQNLDDLVAVSAALDMLARALIKISKDLRLLSSGPETGFAELLLPPVQPGSSIMPGKINPVIPEHAVQLCFAVMGRHAACAAALDHAELDLNIWESTVVVSVLESMQLLQAAAEALSLRCVGGMQASPVASQRAAQALMPMLTELAKVAGYVPVSSACAEAGGDADKLRALLQARFGPELAQIQARAASR